jgi:hypothetical protein
MYTKAIPFFMWSNNGSFNIFILHRVIFVTSEDSKNIVACRPIARQWPRNMQLYNDRCWVTALQTSMFPWQQLHCNTGMVFSVQSMPRCYRQTVSEKLVDELVRGLLQFSCCGLMLWETGSWGRGQFRIPQEKKCSPLEAATQQQQWRHDCGHGGGVCTQQWTL